MSYCNTHTPTRAEITDKVKWQVPMRKKPVYRNCKDGHVSVMYIDEFYLEGELLNRFCKLLPIHSNRRIMTWFGISFSTLQRFKRELGLQKDMRAIIREQANDTKKICENNGWYDSLRGKPVSEACKEATKKMWADGFHPIKALKAKNPRKYKRVMQRRSEKRKALMASETRRVELGLQPKTNLPRHLIGAVRKYTSTEVNKRHAALKRGYILGDINEERYCLFYDQDTTRSALFEKNCIACGFTIQPLPEEETA